VINSPRRRAVIRLGPASVRPLSSSLEFGCSADTAGFRRARALIRAGVGEPRLADPCSGIQGGYSVARQLRWAVRAREAGRVALGEDIA
jgi:hypothetical protein